MNYYFISFYALTILSACINSFIFFANSKFMLSYLSMLAANDRGYGLGRFAGVFVVAQRQSECGSKTAGMHVSQPVNIGILWLFQIIFVKN